MPSVDLRVAVVAGWLVLVGGMALIIGLYALSRRGTHVGPIVVRASDAVLGGLTLALVFPGGLVAGFGHYILDANTGVYGRPDDFRNSATFVDICWFFVLAVAPAFLLLGLATLGFAAFRSLRAHRRQR